MRMHSSVNMSAQHDLLPGALTFQSSRILCEEPGAFVCISKTHCRVTAVKVGNLPGNREQKESTSEPSHASHPSHAEAVGPQ